MAEIDFCYLHCLQCLNLLYDHRLSLVPKSRTEVELSPVEASSYLQGTSDKLESTEIKTCMFKMLPCPQRDYGA